MWENQVSDEQTTLRDEALCELAEMLQAIERDGMTYQQREASRRMHEALARLQDRMDDEALEAREEYPND